MRPVILGILAMFLVLTPSVPAAAAEEPLVKQVGQAIEKGKTYLLGVGKDKGNWEVDTLSATQEGGWTSLALLALLNAGVPPDDPVIQKGLTFLVRIKPKNTYVVGLQTMVLALVDKDNRYKDQIQGNVNWMIEARIRSDGKQLLGWGYGAGDNHGSVNNSNTQYVLLGLHEGMNAGATIAPKDLKEIQEFYLKAEPDGGWGYHRGEESTLTMTSAGVCGLLITGMDLNAGREEPSAGGKFKNCGQYTENKNVIDGLKWIGNALPAQNRWEQMPSFYYTLYGLERVGRLSGLRFIGTHDWYREGCEALVPLQTKDGSWKGRGFDSSPVVSTSFALLFLSKGRTPILISKLTHNGSDGATRYPEDWNNDHNDARHLVEFTSRELFKRTPMGWQVFNTRMMQGRSVDDLAAELMQSPIAYFNGHYAPDFEGKEKEMLQKYVEEGGFIFAEACCGDERFDAGFRKLMKELFKDAELTRLTKDHPIWHATDKFDVNPGRFELWGIESGCKTVVVYSRRDLSCWWESNRYKKGAKDDPDDMGPAAFALGANIIAYATGLEPPPPRLKVMDVARDNPTERKVPPGYLKVAQLRYGEDPPAKRAMPNLMRHLRAKGGLEVDVEPEKTLTITSKGVNDFKFLYMHGKSEIPAKESAELKYLRYDLEKGGGLLLADACCGSKKFDASFREFIAKLLEGKAKLEPIPIGDELFSEELNGPKNAIATVRCRREPASDQRGDGGYKNVEPMLEGVKIGGRWVVIYSKYDIGCALEKIQSSECLGHDHESALRLGSAVVLYALKR
jgi:hypothetical protein